jgi:hypothetical protein
MDQDRWEFSRRELYEMVWRTPLDALAKKYGLSGRGLAKICERHGIPVPPRGYWQRSGVQRRAMRRPLIELQTPETADASIYLGGGHDYRATQEEAGKWRQKYADEPAPEHLLEMWQRLVTEIAPVSVPAKPSETHRLVALWIKRDREEHERLARLGVGSLDRDPSLSAPKARRRLRIISALLIRLEGLGFEVRADDSWSPDFVLQYEGMDLRFDISERIRQYRRELTNAEKVARGNVNQKWAQVSEATGELVLTIKASLPTGIPSSWKDDADGDLESMLHLAIAGLFVAVEYDRYTSAIAAQKKERQREQQKSEQEREQQLRREAQEHEQQLRQEAEGREAARRAEAAKRSALLDQSLAWRQAEDLRAFVAAVQAAVASGARVVGVEDVQAWVEWALAYARELDPIKEASADRDDTVGDS